MHLNLHSRVALASGETVLLHFAFRPGITLVTFNTSMHLP